MNETNVCVRKWKVKLLGALRILTNIITTFSYHFALAFDFIRRNICYLCVYSMYIVELNRNYIYYSLQLTSYNE